MKTWKMRLMALGMVAAAAVGGMTLGSQEAAAAPCCSSCDANYEACLAGCGGYQNDECETSCSLQTRSCYRWCSYSC